MLSPKLVNCIDCASASTLLADIDCKLTDLANLQYNNIVYLLNQPFPSQAVDDLLNYKRILVNKICNPEYASLYTIQMIASKVKLLIHK